MIGIIVIVLSVIMQVQYYGMGAGLHIIKAFSICTGYGVIKVCPYVTATKNVRMRTNLAGLIVAHAA